MKTNTFHLLKICRRSFEAIQYQRKVHEIRSCADRSFTEGDMLLLMEHEGGHHTGRSLSAEVLYTDLPTTFGLPTDLCVMSIKPTKFFNLGDVDVSRLDRAQQGIAR